MRRFSALWFSGSSQTRIWWACFIQYRRAQAAFADDGPANGSCRPRIWGPWRLAFWSLLSLFLELLMIRWISSEIRIFAYFKNFVLIACFLGFGLGCHLSRRRANLLLLVVPLTTLTLLIKLPWRSLRALMGLIPALVGASSEVHVWGVHPEFSFPLLAAAIAIIVPIFSLMCFLFIPLGQLVGWYLQNA